MAACHAEARRAKEDDYAVLEKEVVIFHGESVNIV